MVVNQKDKREIKSNPNKKQTQSKESRALRLIKERKRKAQLRTNPALSIYESGRERTKRVVKKEYPLVNINKLPSILTKGNDDIGVVWKNTNKIQSHTLFSETNLPCREPASKDDIYYYVAPFKEPKTVDNVIDEFKKFKLRFAKEIQNRYPDIKANTLKSKVPSSKLNENCQIKKKYDLKTNIPTSFLNDNVKENRNGFVDIMDGSYEESLKNSIMPFISKISTNPLAKDQFISELGLDKISKNKNYNESLHKVKKKISKNNTRNKFGDSIILNKGLIGNNFDSIMNAIQPLDSIISAKPINFNQSLFTEKDIKIPNINIDEPDLNKVKIEENILFGEDSIVNKDEGDLIMNLLTKSENEGEKYDNELLNNSMALQLLNDIDNDFGTLVPPKRKGTLDAILEPFKVPVDDTKIKSETNKMEKNNVNSFNYFNFDDMNLPKIELPQDLMATNMEIENIALFNNELGLDNTIIKKELSSNGGIFEKKCNNGGSGGDLGEIARFGSNKIKESPNSKIKSDDFDLRKVKQEDGSLAIDLINSNVFSPLSVMNQIDNASLVNNTLLDDLLTNNESLIHMDNNMLTSITNTNIAVECYNTEMKFVNTPFVLSNALDYESNVIKPSSNMPKESLLPSQDLNMMKEIQYDINTISKNTPIQKCCPNSIPLSSTINSNIKSIPDWYNQNDFGFINANILNNIENVQKSNDSDVINPLLPVVDASVNEKMFNKNFVEPHSIPEFSNEILNETVQYSSLMNTDITLPYTGVSKDNKVKSTGNTALSTEVTEKVVNEKLSDSIVEEIIERVAKDDRLKEKTNSTCFIGQNIQETGKMLKKMSKEIDELVSKQLDASEKKWKEWRKDIKDYENEAHQWLNARIEFYSRRVNEYRKDWIEYWIKRYLMQQKQQIKALSYYINIPQNLQFASNLCLDTEDSSTTTAKIGTTIATAIATNDNTNGTLENKKNTVKSVGRETIEQFKKSSTTSLVALTAEISKDPRLEVSGRTIELANKDLLNDPKLIEAYHEKLLFEKKLLLEKYDIVDSLDIIPTLLIKPITNGSDNEMENNQNESLTDSNGGSTGYKGKREGEEELASVLIDEYVKAPFESKRIFIHGIPKDYQLMFNDKMKSLIFILDKCIQDKKDLYSTMKVNRKEYSIEDES